MTLLWTIIWGIGENVWCVDVSPSNLWVLYLKLFKATSYELVCTSSAIALASSHAQQKYTTRAPRAGAQFPTPVRQQHLGSTVNGANPTNQAEWLRKHITNSTQTAYIFCCCCHRPSYPRTWMVVLSYVVHDRWRGKLLLDTSTRICWLIVLPVVISYESYACLYVAAAEHDTTLKAQWQKHMAP